jgi:putative MATE family efflux protein
MKENILGTEKISKLMIKFSIPCIISLLVNSLYNIVDQIFIGWGVGYLGNGATNIVFPITMISLAFSLMLGDGAGAFLSIKLGEKKKEEASIGVGNAITLSVIISTLLCTTSIIFMPKLLNIFGATEALLPYAKSYGYIIAMGVPFMMIGTTLNSIIRSDGNPAYAMKTMVIGALLNTILDPIFIFIFKWGVTGAALATITSQILTFILNVLYLKKIESIKINKKSFKLTKEASKKISSLGISSFITQMSFVLVITVENNMLKKYGIDSKFGPEIPITVLGIVMKISQILNSIIIGLAVGAQPILGYNYGAGKYERVIETLKKTLKVSLIISTIAFILFQTIPDKLIGLFGNGDELYIEFACMSFRIYLMLVIFNGIQIPSGIFFQAIGKSLKSAILSLSRQILFLIPSMIILGKIFKIKGVLYSGPLADSLAFVLSVILIMHELKIMNQQTSIPENRQEKTDFTNNKNHLIITISREYGSGGRYIGKLVAQKLGIKLYDKQIITTLSEQTGLSTEYIKTHEQKTNMLDNFNNGYYYTLNNNDELFIKESELIKKLAKQDSCVIIGRCADYILKDEKNVTRIFIYSDMKNKIKRATKYYKLNKSTAEKEINTINKLRSNHYKHYTGKTWNDPKNYDLCINSDTLGVEDTAELIYKLINK